jgi:hypothetical protein
VLQAAFAAHDGRVVLTQGDSFFVAFRTAADAVASAVDAQRDLPAQSWPEGVELKVRMGLHTGEPKVGAERYVGIGVHRAARIGAAGHGGQVLLSSTIRELAEEELPVGVSIRDLGTRRLKDIDQPQRLYQLVIEGLESEFGRVNTLDVEFRRKRRRMYAGAALIGRQRYFVNSRGLTTIWSALNTSRPLFSDARMRRAVNYALDRRALARIGAFGTDRGTATDQVLPPAIPGSGRRTSTRLRQTSTKRERSQAVWAGTECSTPAPARNAGRPRRSSRRT